MAAVDDTGPASEDKDERPDEEQPGAAAEEFLTVYEAHALIGPRLGLSGLALSERLSFWIREGAVEQFNDEPITEWLERSWSLVPPHFPPEPNPKYLRYRKHQLEAAILNDPLHHLRLVCTADPGPSARPWISHAVARVMVADAGGLDQDPAAAWLAARSRRSDLPLRTRFAPLALAAAERKSERERLRKRFFPHLNMIFHGGDADIRRHPGCCLWFRPAKEALAGGECSESGLALAQVEWHADELAAVLTREFPADAATRSPEPAAVVSSPDQDENDLSPSEKREGRQPDWPWSDVVAEASMDIQDFIGPDGKVIREALIAHVQRIAERLGPRKPKRSGARPHAKAIWEAWERRVGNTSDVGK
jgi:hypothetical protein